MLDLGLCSAILPNYSFEKTVAYAKANNFKCLEIMCWPTTNTDSRRYAGVTHLDVENLDVSYLKSIQNTLLANNVYISALGYYPNILDADTSQTDFFITHLKKVISFANLLGLQNVNTFIGRDQSKNLDYNLGKYAEIWPEIVKYAEQYKVKIGIENCPMHFSNDEWPGGKNLAISPYVWDKMFAIIPSDNLGLNYDPSHMVWQMMDYIQPLHDFKEKLFHIHLKDAKVYKDKLDKVGIMANPLEYHSPKLPGKGDIDWQKFIETLNNVGYNGPLVIEFEDKDFEKSESGVLEGIDLAKKYIESII